MPIGTLEVQLLTANGLQNVEWIGLKQDPYCIVQIDRQKHRSITHTDGGQNPTWEETLKFYEITHLSTSLNIQIFDENMLLKDVYIGECQIPVEQAVKTGFQSVSAKVFIKTGKKAKNGPKQMGNLLCNLRFYPNQPRPQAHPGSRPSRQASQWILEKRTALVTDKYIIGRPLGKGSYGETVMVTHKQNRSEYACKIIPKKAIFSARMDEDVRREIRILNHLYKAHPNIIDVEEVFEDEHRLYIIMELCTGGELFEAIIERATPYTERDAAKLIRTILEVVGCCHATGVVHRDLKPENFLFTKRGPNGVLKAIDFGLGVFFKDGDVMFDQVGSAYYMAPEILLARLPSHDRPGQGYGKEVDIWSCGVILYILLTGEPPFYGDHDHDTHRAIRTQEADLDRQPWPAISSAAKDCVRKMLTRDPAKRARVEDLLNHPWINGNAPNTEIKLVVLDRLKGFVRGNRLKREAMLMLARELPADELEGVLNTFKALDKDGNGVITIDEMRQGLKELGGKLPETELLKIMELADVNGDGNVDYQEFIAATMNHARVLRRDRIEKVFNELDKDGSGFLEMNELSQAFNMLRMDDISMVDQDNDGKISLEEFMDMMVKDC